MPVDVVDRLGSESTTRDRHLQVEVLGVPVLLGRLADRRRVGRGPRPLVADELDARVAEIARQPGKQPVGHRRVHQQRLGRVAHAGTLDLRVVGNPPRHLEVGVLVHVHVAVARRRVHHGHRRHLLERGLQPAAAARDHQVDQAVGSRQLGELLAPAREQLDAALRQLGLGQRLAHERGERAVRALGVARAAQDDRVARLQAQRRAVDRHVRPRLVDHGDDAERHPQLAHLEAAAKHAAVDLLADRIGQRRDRVDARGHRLDPLRRERQPVAKRLGQPLCALVRQVRSVRGEHVVRALAQQCGEARQRRVLRRRRTSRASTSDASRALSQASVTVRVVVAIVRKGYRRPDRVCRCYC